MRYVTGPTRSTAYPAARRYGLGRPGLGDSEFDPTSPLVQWFERRQKAGWCELYPHLLSLYSAQSKFRRFATEYDAVANNLAISSLYPELAAKASEAADRCRERFEDCKRLRDFLYAVKDYVLGAEFGREGSGFENWCRDRVQPKSIDQMIQEADSMGLGGVPALGRAPGLGTPIAIGYLVVGGLAIVSIVAALYIIRNILKDKNEHERILENVERCGKGDERACARADKDVETINKARLAEAERPDAFESVATVVKWLAVGVVGVVAYKAFTQSKYAKGKDAPAPVPPPSTTP